MQLRHTVLTSIAILCCALTSAIAAPATLPVPVVGWDGTRPATEKIGDELPQGTSVFSGTGSDASLKAFTFEPTTIEYIKTQNCHATWTDGPDGLSAIALGNKDKDPVLNGVLQCGTGIGTLKTGQQFSMCATFRLKRAMTFGGGNPSFELDGYIIGMPVTKTPWDTSIRLAIRGKGKDGKAPRVPYLRISNLFPNSNERYFSEYAPEMTTELAYDQWYTVVVTWDGTQPSDHNWTPNAGETQRVRMWINGKEYHVQRTGHPNISPDTFNNDGPIYLGGNRSYDNAPIDLGPFAIYSTVLTEQQVNQLFTAKPAAK